MSTLGCPLAIVTSRMTTCWGHPEITAKGDNPTSPAESGHFFCYVDPFLGTKICTIIFLQFIVQPLLKLFNAGMSFPRCLTETLQTSSISLLPLRLLCRRNWNPLQNVHVCVLGAHTKQDTQVRTKQMGEPRASRRLGWITFSSSQPSIQADNQMDWATSIKCRRAHLPTSSRWHFRWVLGASKLWVNAICRSSANTVRGGSWGAKWFYRSPRRGAWSRSNSHSQQPTRTCSILFIGHKAPESNH